MMVLVGCDVAQEQAQQNRAQPTQVQSPAGQSQGTSSQSSPRSSSSAALGDQQIGRGGVAYAQEPIPTALPGDASALSEYERIINNVYGRNINAVVNLTDGNATGSGFVIDQEGHIVTNNHVAGEMQQIFITFADRSVSRGELVGTFPEGDIAVVRAERVPEGIQPVELGDSSTVRVGQITVAIGSPLGLQQTVTSGIVSALNRSIQDLGENDPDSSLQGLIQTDASINPGNSGGPLFDSRGRVIGMNTLIASRNEGNIGLGFAVPVNRIKRVVRQLIETSQYRRPKIGASVVPVDPELALQLNFPTTSGVMLSEVVQGGPSDQAGLQGATEGVTLSGGERYPTNGDIITAINGQPVRTIGDLRNILETEADAGDSVTITFLRGGREQQTQLTLGQ
ncbi:MAG: trypsin-like peptidase domain-containing protein [Chloroflexi bacterium]|nr:trypsin-like peptidase domain-containing protein [Chloroflexota bacterium]